MPKSILKIVGRMCAAFLWGGRQFRVAWKEIGSPKDEGGLGLMDLKIWNMALLTSTLWNIHAEANTLWVKWLCDIRDVIVLAYGSRHRAIDGLAKMQVWMAWLAVRWQEILSGSYCCQVCMILWLCPSGWEMGLMASYLFVHFVLCSSWAILGFPPTPGTPPPVAPPPPPTRKGAATAAEMVHGYSRVGGVWEGERGVAAKGGRVGGVKQGVRMVDEERGVAGMGSRVGVVKQGVRMVDEERGVADMGGRVGGVGGVKKVERRVEDVGVGDWEEGGGRGRVEGRDEDVGGGDWEDERGVGGDLEEEGGRGVGGERKYRGGREGGVGVLRRKKREGNMKRWVLGFRVCEMVVCVVSFSVMATDKTQGWAGDSYDRYKEYRYCLGVNVIGFVHAGFQAFDLACNLASGKHILSHLHYHFEFLMDQASILAYLLMSASSSVATRVDDWVSNWGKDTFTEMATVSVAMSFLAFFAFAISSLISGYNLCNRDSS
ncbi:hypothetical protein Leryth_014982 [Lithospermum erythrorhizon]|nr:hypothetical protein Leryth_014982 [Lithospermum erythrorhizon]